MARPTASSLGSLSLRGWPDAPFCSGYAVSLIATEPAGVRSRGKGGRPPTLYVAAEPLPCLASPHHDARPLVYRVAEMATPLGALEGMSEELDAFKADAHPHMDAAREADGLLHNG